MAIIYPRTLDGRPVRLVFRSRLIRALNLLPWVNIGGIVLSAGTVRFKRQPEEVPRELVAHELGHIRQARRLGWRYLPTYLVRHGRMEEEAWEAVPAILDSHDWISRQFGPIAP